MATTINIRHYNFIIDSSDVNTTGNVNNLFQKIDKYYDFTKIDKFFKDNQNFENREFTDLTITLSEIPYTGDILDKYEIIQQPDQSQNNEATIKQIINSVKFTINILFFKIDNNAICIINKHEKNKIINDIKINKNLVINDFNILRKDLLYLLLPNDNKEKDYKYPLDYDFNLNYKKMITTLGNKYPLLNKIYLIDKHIYTNGINLNEFNYNTYFIPYKDLLTSKETFISLFYNLNKMANFHKYVISICNIYEDDETKILPPEIEILCNIKLEELKNKKIITYLKINNTNPLKTINQKRYDIYINDTKQKMLLKYDESPTEYYNPYGYPNQDIPEVNPEIKNYLLGNFTNIFLPEESNTYISEKYMQPIINNLIEEKPVFIFGYGTSGSGKTSSLIYYRDILDSNKNENGIISNLCLKTIQEFKTKGITITKLKVTFQEISNESIIVLPRPLLFDGDLKYIPNENNEDNEVDIKHQYRINEIANNPEYISLFSIFNFDQSRKKYYYTASNTLSEIVQYLVDTDRHVKATLNNPQSSRSHALIYIEFYQNADFKTILIVGDFAGVESNFKCNSKDVLEKMLGIENTITKKPFYYNLIDYNTHEEFIDDNNNDQKPIQLEIEQFIKEEEKKKTFFIKKPTLDTFTNKIIDVCEDCITNKNINICIDSMDSAYTNDLIYLISINQIIDFTKTDFTVEDVKKYLLENYNRKYEMFNVINYIKNKNKIIKKKLKLQKYDYDLFYELPIILNIDTNIENTARNYKDNYNNHESKSNDIIDNLNNYYQSNNKSRDIMSYISNYKNDNADISSVIDDIIKNISNMSKFSDVSLIYKKTFTKIYENELIDIYIIQNDEKFIIKYMSGLHPNKYIPIIFIKKDKKDYDILQKLKTTFIEKKKEMSIFVTNPGSGNTQEKLEIFDKYNDKNNYTLLSNFLMKSIKDNTYNNLQKQMIYDLVIVETFFMQDDEKCIEITDENKISLKDKTSVDKFNNLLKYYYLTVEQNDKIEKYVNLIFNKFNKIINSCLLRNNEGDFINRSLFNLNKDIIEITKKNMNIQGSENKNFYNSFLLKSCKYEMNINKVQLPYTKDENKNNIIELIKQHCNNGGLIENFEEKIIFCIIGFLNISSLTDNPPKVKYVDTSSDTDTTIITEKENKEISIIDKCIYWLNIIKISVNRLISTIEEKNEKKKNNLKEKIIGDLKSLNEDLKEKIVFSSNDYDDVNYLKKFNTDLEKLIIQFTEQLPVQTEKQKIFEQIERKKLEDEEPNTIENIKKTNNYTTLGTLEYIDRMAKFNVTENICSVADNSIKNNVYEGTQFYSLDYFSNLF